MICIIAGTNHKYSMTHAVASAYKATLDSMRIENAVLNLADLPPDFIETALYERQGTNDTFNQFQETIDQSQKVVFVVPEYNGSYPGVMKAFIDGLRYPDSLQFKKGAMVGLSSGSQGCALGMSHLNDVLTFMGMYMLPTRPRLAHIDDAVADGELINPSYSQLLEQQAALLADF